MSDSQTPDDGTQDPPTRNTRRGVVTKVYPHTTPNDNSNYEVDIRLVDGEEGVDDSQTSETYTRIPVEVSAQGEVRGIETGQLVNISYYANESESPYVSGVAYTLEDRAPLAKQGDWRQRHDETTLESVRDGDGRLVRVGHQPDDRGDLDSGLHLSVAKGGFELYDTLGNGLCCDGEGNVILSSSGGASGALSGTTETTTAPLSTSSNQTTSETSTTNGTTRADSGEWVNIGDSTISTQSADVDTQTVDLSTQGIAEGEAIDPYLEEYFRDGMTVYVPPGTYTWNGGGLSGTYENAELIGGIAPGDVGDDGSLPPNPPQTVLTRTDGWSGTAAITCDGGEAGSVNIRNLTIQGANGADPAFSLSVTDPAASMILDSVYLPDGDTTAATEAAVLVEPGHMGTLHLRNLFMQNFRNGGVDASPPGQLDSGGMRGRTLVAGGLYRDNNIANLRISGVGSAVRQVTSIQTGAAPGDTTLNPRAVWLSDYVEAEISDSDVIYQDNSGPAVVLGDGADLTHAEGFLDGNRIQNDHTDAIINVHSGEWSGSGNHFTGSGNLTPTGGDFDGTCSGSGCETPTRTPREVS